MTRRRRGKRGDEIAQAAERGSWASAFASWDAAIRAFDEFLVGRQKDKDVKEYKRFTHEGFESLMTGKKRLEDLRGKPGLTRLAAVFYLRPKAEYRLQRNMPSAVPLSVYYWREGGKWQMRDYTDPDRDPVDHDLPDAGGAAPDTSLIEQLDHKSEYPLGIIHWKIPGGTSGDFATTEKETTGEKVRGWLMRVAAIGAAVGLALTGVGVLVDAAWLGAAGGVVLFVSAGAGVAAATTDLVVKAKQGTLHATDVAIDVGQIVASLAAMGQIPAGAFVNEMRGGAQLTGWAARAAAVSKTLYIPLKYANIVGDTITVVGVTADVYVQLQAVKKLPPGQQEEAFLALVSELFLTVGMSLISINGAAKEIAEGTPKIRVKSVDGVPTAFIEGATPRATPAGPARTGAPEPSRGPRAPESGGHEPNVAARAESVRASGHIDEPTPRQLANEADYVGEHPEIVEGAAPRRKAKIGEHEWKENDRGWCRLSKAKCFDANGKEIDAVRTLDVDKYGELTDRSVSFDALQNDHIPSYAACKAAVERALKRQLTSDEAANLRRNLNALTEPDAVHRGFSRTYGGRNNAEQILLDSQNLAAAAKKDMADLRQPLIKSGQKAADVDLALQKIDQANRAAGVYDPATLKKLIK